MNSLMLEVTDIERLNDRVSRFRFEDPNRGRLPEFSGGAHVVVEMPDGETLRRNSYSLVSDPLDGTGYEIAVQRDDQGRGGSVFMHSQVKCGDVLRVTTPTNLLALDLRAKKHLLIAGGIGITPFLAQVAQLRQMGLSYELHYAVRTLNDAAALKMLTDVPHVIVHISDRSGRMDLDALLSKQPLGTHVYTCGPERLISAVKHSALAQGWTKSAIHSEAFTAPKSGESFVVTLAKSGKTLTVGPHQSLLEALEEAEIDVTWSCRGGVCGQCETAISKCVGSVDHNDHWLDEDTRASQTKIMPCVSRFQGQDLVLDL